MTPSAHRIDPVWQSARPLAVEARHLGRWVAFTRGRSLRDRPLNAAHVLRCQCHVERTKRLSEPIAPPGADQRDDVLALSGHPGDGKPRDTDAFRVRHGSELFDQREVAVGIVSLERRAPPRKSAALAPPSASGH